MNERFTEKAQQALNRSIAIAEDLGHTYIGTEHLMLALFEDDASSSAQVLKKSKTTHDGYKKAVIDYSGVGMKSTLSGEDITPRCKRILEVAYSVAGKYFSAAVGTEHILYSLLDERECIATKLLKSLGCDVASLKEDALGMIRVRSHEINDSRPIQAPILNQYGKNFNDMARKDKFDPVIGRDSETDRLIRVLCRKNKNNPCLIGEAGVGKSAIVEGLAGRIVRGDVPSYLKNKVIISIDLTSMVAGAKYRGDFEERIKGIINEASRNKSIILFIDEIHTIVGAGAAEGAIDASNILKPQLSRGELQIIGATTFSEYKKYIQRDSALERRFQPITVEEPDAEKTYEMLRGVKSRYEMHHGVTINDDVLGECVALSVRYITDRFLPDKALDLLDEASAYVAFNDDIKRHKTSISNEIAEQKAKYKMDAVYKNNFELALKVSEEERKSSKTHPHSLRCNLSDNCRCVTVDDVKYIVSEMTGIDITSVRSSLDYNNIEENIRSRIVGQDDAVSKLVKAIKRSEVGLGDPNRPRGTFLFVGGSGVGKTALATALAEELFSNKNALLRFDMSEYSEKYSVSKLIGSPPGYSGHDEGGVLTESVRKRPYCVVLFDEIEKADREVQNLFLQIADSGFITDSSGKRISFRNTYVIMTSNAVSSSLADGRQLGFIEDKSIRDSRLLDALKKRFADEFINRFDEIIVFGDLDEKSKKQIVRIALKKLADKLDAKKIHLSFDEAVIKYIVDEVDVKKLGARPILHFISANIENALSDYLVQHKESEGSSVNIEVSEEGITISEPRCELLRK